MIRQLLFIAIMLITSSLYGQNANMLHDSIMESNNDSADLANGFYELYHEMNTPAYELYKSWSNSRLKYIPRDSVIRSIDKYLEMDSTMIVLNDSSRSYSMPVKKNRVTSGFGRRYYRFHYGTDLDLFTGDSVWTVFDGMVRYSGYYHGYGKTVVVRHYNGLETVYSHLSRILVDTNDYVKAGELIGYGGSTGRSTGSHLHFETRYLGAAFDSELIFDYDSFCLRTDTLWLTPNAFAYLGPVRDRRNASYHYIKSGDNLGKIARMYGTSISSLCRLNGISRTTILRIGRKLRVR